MSIETFALQYQKSPIVLTNGIAVNMPDPNLPLVSITQAQDFNQGVLSGSDSLDLTDFLFDFMPAPGSTLAEYSIATFPFANSQVAANAIIAEPLKLSYVMQAPVRDPGGYAEKLAVFQNLQTALAQHAALGGTYTLATPAWIYVGCLLTSLRDITDDPKQPQSRWQWDFVQPLLSLQQARQAYNSQYTKLGGGLQLTPNASGALSPSGLGPAVGVSTSNVGPSIVPALRPLPAGAASGPNPTPQGPVGP